MKICYLGAGTWGFCLASLLASKGNEVALWTKRDDFAKLLAKTRQHPKLPNFEAHQAVIPTSDLAPQSKMPILLWSLSHPSAYVPSSNRSAS